MQNINLYVPDLRPNSAWLTEKSLAYGLVVFVVFLILLTFIDRHSVNQYKASVLATESKNTTQREDVEKIKAKRPSFALQSMDEEILRLRAEIDDRYRVIELIGRKNLGNVHGYSSRLKALSEYSSPDISIVHFRFSSGSDRVDIRGSSLKPEAPVNIIGKLQNTESYRQASFGALTISDFDESINAFHYSFGFEPLFKHQDTLLGLNK
jgi:hypothetical protein